MTKRLLVSPIQAHLLILNTFTYLDQAIAAVSQTRLQLHRNLHFLCYNARLQIYAFTLITKNFFGWLDRKFKEIFCVFKENRILGADKNLGLTQPIFDRK